MSAPDANPEPPSFFTLTNVVKVPVEKVDASAVDAMSAGLRTFFDAKIGPYFNHERMESLDINSLSDEERKSMTKETTNMSKLCVKISADVKAYISAYISHLKDTITDVEERKIAIRKMKILEQLVQEESSTVNNHLCDLVESDDDQDADAYTENEEEPEEDESSPEYDYEEDTPIARLDRERKAAAAPEPPAAAMPIEQAVPMQAVEVPVGFDCSAMANVVGPGVKPPAAAPAATPAAALKPPAAAPKPPAAPQAARDERKVLKRKHEDSEPTVTELKNEFKDLWEGRFQGKFTSAALTTIVNMIGRERDTKVREEKAVKKAKAKANLEKAKEALKRVAGH